jgi:hypothetical protein
VSPQATSPGNWDDILDEVRPVFGADAVIAGGAVRDYLLGLWAKDIDIFVNAANIGELVVSVELLDKYPGWNIQMIEMSDLAGNGDISADDYAAWGRGEGTLVGVAEGDWNGIPVNIIARRSHHEGISDLIESFDFGIVQVAYEGDGRYRMTEAHVVDRRFRTATITVQKYADLSVARFQRFNDRNPGVLTLVNPFDGVAPVPDFADL